ncbi:hypothetical protein GZH47_30665 [Paenibacillus rhizovicinus]|uniref:Cation/H+ exchanger domain-containing protein n=1 Tax=Paenibacillus rhizovicinus TaxID=2704463 RepID=A0A6C0P8L3_9BACL|nr:hypothetical protein [Paenibacillus rhizovicinus]QHW34731.1 hypothetical protein GZH47_30665 [Paenibacillus rhizovicinus]
MRGAVTLAGAFSIPYVLQNGSPFPERDLMIFLAAIVILLSLAVASVLLPLLARKKAAPGTSGEQAQKRHVRIQVLEAAIQALKTEQNQENGHAASSVIADYTRSRSLTLRIIPAASEPQERTVLGSHSRRTG